MLLTQSYWRTSYISLFSQLWLYYCRVSRRWSRFCHSFYKNGWWTWCYKLKRKVVIWENLQRKRLDHYFYFRFVCESRQGSKSEGNLGLTLKSQQSVCYIYDICFKVCYISESHIAICARSVPSAQAANSSKACCTKEASIDSQSYFATSAIQGRRACTKWSVCHFPETNRYWLPANSPYLQLNVWIENYIKYTFIMLACGDVTRSLGKKAGSRTFVRAIFVVITSSFPRIRIGSAILQVNIMSDSY